MDLELLQSHGIVPLEVRLVYARDHAIQIGRRAYLKPQSGRRAYGMAMNLSIADIRRLYEGESVRDYQPVAIPVVESAHKYGTMTCYNLTGVPEGDKPNPEYARSLANLVRALGLPESYAREIDLFASPDRVGSHG